MADLGLCPPINDFLMKAPLNQGWAGLCLQLKSFRVGMRVSAPMQEGPPLWEVRLWELHQFGLRERCQSRRGVLSENTLGEAQSARGRAVRSDHKGMEGPREALPFGICTNILGGSCNHRSPISQAPLPEAFLCHQPEYSCKSELSLSFCSGETGPLGGVTKVLLSLFLASPPLRKIHQQRFRRCNAQGKCQASWAVTPGSDGREGEGHCFLGRAGSQGATKTGWPHPDLGPSYFHQGEVHP